MAKNRGTSTFSAIHDSGESSETESLLTRGPTHDHHRYYGSRENKQTDSVHTNYDDNNIDQTLANDTHCCATRDNYTNNNYTHSINEPTSDQEDICCVQNGSPSRYHHKIKTFSILQARVVSTLTLVLYAMGMYTTNSVLSQYLQHRWLKDAHIDPKALANHSVCYSNKSSEIFQEQNDIQSKVK